MKKHLLPVMVSMAAALAFFAPNQVQAGGGQGASRPSSPSGGRQYGYFPV
jgi:hypothetical protein